MEDLVGRALQSMCTVTVSFETLFLLCSEVVCYLINLTVASYKNLVGFGVSVNHHTDGVKSEGTVKHGRKLSACFCQRIADHKCLPTISIATKANQTSSGCSWEEGLLLWQWRQRDVVPFVQAWIKSRAISVVIISEHQKPWFLCWGFWVSLQESGRVYQIVPSFTHTAKPEETCYWQASQDSFYKMLWKIAPNVCSHYNLIGIASRTSIFTVHHFEHLQSSHLWPCHCHGRHCHQQSKRFILNKKLL